jgi:hypothetical protein
VVEKKVVRTTAPSSHRYLKELVFQAVYKSPARTGRHQTHVLDIEVAECAEWPCSGASGFPHRFVLSQFAAEVRHDLHREMPHI